MGVSGSRGYKRMGVVGDVKGWVYLEAGDIKGWVYLEAGDIK